MVEHLKRICQERGLELIFVTDKYIDFQSAGKSQCSQIKVHKIFQNCPLRVAKAVITICTEQEVNDRNIAIVENYLREKLNLNPVQFEIPKDNGIENNEFENIQSSEESYVDGMLEANISTIVVKGLWGEKKSLSKNESLLASEDDVLELDIVVKSPLHK